MKNLGTLGGSESAARGINDSGQVIGWSFTSTRYSHAFLYSGGKMRSLGTMSQAASSSAASDINNLGQIVGESDLYPVGTHAFLYSGGKMQDLGSLGDPSLGSHAAGVNNSGHAVGWASAWVGGRSWTHAFLNQDGVMRDLGTPANSNSSFAAAINDHGQIAASAYVPVNGQEASRAFIYSANQWFDIGTLPGGSPIAGGYWPYPYNLGQISGGGSIAYDINNSGHVVGSSRTASKEMHAYLYKNGVIYNLNYLLPAKAGWTLTEARSINDDGQIVGFGVIKGEEHAFLLDPNFSADQQSPGHHAGEPDCWREIRCWGQHRRNRECD
ncbi:MAG: DUF3466 family protein [Pyrinomonadaceae bacterium]